jgi:hypothetical protein
VDDKDAPGCPHDETPPWVADQYHFTGSNAAGWHFYGRNSGGSASAAHARALAHNLNYSECWVPWWSSEIACRD